VSFPATWTRLDYLRRLAELKEQDAEYAAAEARKYLRDPAGWARDCIRWPVGRQAAPYQLEVMEELPRRKRIAVRGPHGLGKALPLGMRIPTPCGWSTIGDLRVGDEIFDENGQICHVTGKSEIFTADVYEITFADGTVMKSHGQHEWNAIDVYRRPNGVKDWRDYWDATRTVTTEHMSRNIKSPSGQLRWRIPTTRPLSLPNAPLPIDPYLLGVWLGDGATADSRITLNRADSGLIVSRIPGGHFTNYGEKDNSRAYSIPGLRQQLRALGVLGNKHIPEIYRRASIAQRRELVRGLWDTDGYTQSGGCDEIALTCERLALDVAELLRSLGLVVRISESDAKLNGRIVSRRWRIAARFDFRPYHLERYPWAERASQGSRHTQRTITTIRRVDDEPTQCISVSSPSRLYLAGDSMVPTHNSTTMSQLVLWFATTRSLAEIDWKVITTASVWRQLEVYLWPEIHKWAKMLDWEQLGRGPFLDRVELLDLRLKLPWGAASAVASNQAERVEGAHADEILYILDEAKIIPPETWDAIEGALSNAGDDTDFEAYVVAMSTPGPPNGRFYDIHSRKPGYEDWWTRHVTLDEAITAGRVSRQWAEQRAKQWGITSALYQGRVLGEFCADDENAVIPLSWVEAAVERWHVWDRAGRPALDGPTWTGVDVGRGGDDSVLARLAGQAFTITAKKTPDTMALAELAAQEPGRLIVDVVGVGAGVFDRLRQMKAKGALKEWPLAYVGSGASTRKDRSGKYGFAGVRSAAYWFLRECLDPEYEPTLCLPPDDLLLSDLTAPTWELTAAVPAKYKIEKKEDVVARLGRSPDRGDAVVMGLWATITRAPMRVAEPVGTIPRTGLSPLA